MWREMQERGDAPQTPSLTDAEREAIELAMYRCNALEFKTLRGLLERMQ